MEFTANSIAALIDGKVEGDGNVVVNDFAKIEEGKPGALSFLANPKYTHYIYDTQSSVVLVSNDFEAERPIAATLIRVENPYDAIGRLLQIYQQAMAQAQGPRGVEQPSFVAEGVEVPADAYIGAFAYVGAGAKLGQGVKIYPQTYVGAGCEIGEGTVLYPGVKVYYGCRIGRNCIIHSGAVIGADGFGFAPQPDGSYEKIPQLGIVEIGDNVEIGANTTIDRSVMGATRIADGVKLDNLIQIAHNVEVGANTAMAAQVGVAGSAKIGAQCMIGGQVGIAGHIKIADRTMLGAQAGVNHGTKEGEKLMGSPAIPIMEYARQVALGRRLSDLFNRVDKIEKDLRPTK